MSITDEIVLFDSRQAWSEIEQRLQEAELDGFLAGYFLSYYCNEDHKAKLSSKIDNLQDAFDITRSNVAMLGIALERGWIAPLAPVIQNFLQGYERLERQQAGPGLTWHSSLKILWGVALGFKARDVTSTRPDLLPKLVKTVSNFRQQSHNNVRDYILSSVVLVEIDPSGRETVIRETIYYLLHQNMAYVSDADVLAVLWFLRQKYSAPDATLNNQAQLDTIYRQLLSRLFQIHRPDDVIDACLLYQTQSELARDVSTGRSVSFDALSVVLRTIDKFHELARRLKDRKYKRPPFVIENEYDVQDLLYVSLKPHIPDLTDEEWTTKDADRAKRIDFVSVVAKLCVEAKKTRDADHAKKIADELKIDIESYYVHEACDTLVIFVYDPDGFMVDAAQQEKQLSGTRIIKGRRVEVIVKVRPY